MSGFHEVGLHEFGQLNSTPNAIIAEVHRLALPERTRAS